MINRDGTKEWDINSYQWIPIRKTAKPKKRQKPKKSSQTAANELSHNQTVESNQHISTAV